MLCFKLELGRLATLIYLFIYLLARQERVELEAAAGRALEDKGYIVKARPKPGDLCGNQPVRQVHPTILH